MEGSKDMVAVVMEEQEERKKDYFLSRAFFCFMGRNLIECLRPKKRRSKDSSSSSSSSYLPFQAPLPHFFPSLPTERERKKEDDDMMIMIFLTKAMMML